LSQTTHLTDGRTEQTDSFLITRPCLHSMQRGKNQIKGNTLQMFKVKG